MGRKKEPRAGDMPQGLQAPYLYHYTTAEGFKGIVQRQEIWATDIFYLNDWAELHHGRDMLKAAIRATTPQGEEYEAIANRVCAVFDRLSLKMPRHAFVCSFSEAHQGDDLSQWRAYCPNGGYTIGFRSDLLQEQGKKSHFALRKCVYGSDSGDAVQAFGQELSGRHRPSLDLGDCEDTTLALAAARLKNAAFHAEQEWRLISSYDHADILRFRTSGALLVPYVAVDLKDEALWENARIVVGPCSRDNAELKLKSAKMLLEYELTKHGLPTISVDHVRHSTIPYRATLAG